MHIIKSLILKIILFNRKLKYTKYGDIRSGHISSKLIFKILQGSKL
jgi:hypothetical protein